MGLRGYYRIVLRSSANGFKLGIIHCLWDHHPPSQVVNIVCLIPVIDSIPPAPPFGQYYYYHLHTELIERALNGMRLKYSLGKHSLIHLMRLFRSILIL